MFDLSMPSDSVQWYVLGGYALFLIFCIYPIRQYFTRWVHVDEILRSKLTPQQYAVLDNEYEKNEDEGSWVWGFMLPSVLFIFILFDAFRVLVFIPPIFNLWCCFCMYVNDNIDEIRKSALIRHGITLSKPTTEYENNNQYDSDHDFVEEEIVIDENGYSFDAGRFSGAEKAQDYGFHVHRSTSEKATVDERDISMRFLENADKGRIEGIKPLLTHDAQKRLTHNPVKALPAPRKKKLFALPAPIERRA